MLALHRSVPAGRALAAYKGVAVISPASWDRPRRAAAPAAPGDAAQRSRAARADRVEAARPVVVPSQLPADIADFVGRTS